MSWMRTPSTLRLHHHHRQNPTWAPKPKRRARTGWRGPGSVRRRTRDPPIGGGPATAPGATSPARRTSSFRCAAGGVAPVPHQPHPQGSARRGCTPAPGPRATTQGIDPVATPVGIITEAFRQSCFPPNPPAWGVRRATNTETETTKSGAWCADGACRRYATRSSS